MKYKINIYNENKKRYELAFIDNIRLKQITNNSIGITSNPNILNKMVKFSIKEGKLGNKTIFSNKIEEFEEKGFERSKKFINLENRPDCFIFLFKDVYFPVFTAKKLGTSYEVTIGVNKLLQSENLIIEFLKTIGEYI